MQIAGGDRTADGARHQFARGGVGRVALHDDGAPGCEGGSRVAPRNRKSEREIRCAENSHGAEWYIHAAQIRPRRRAVGHRRIDRDVEPETGADFRREKAQLVYRARPFAFKPGAWQSAFDHDIGDQIVANGFNLIRDSFQKTGARLWTERGEAFCRACG